MRLEKLLGRLEYFGRDDGLVLALELLAGAVDLYFGAGVLEDDAIRTGNGVTPGSRLYAQDHARSLEDGPGART